MNTEKLVSCFPLLGNILGNLGMNGLSGKQFQPYFGPTSTFYTPWKPQTTTGFLMFSGVWKRNIGLKYAYEIYFYFQQSP